MYIFLFWGSFFLRSFFCRVGKSKDYIIYHKENQLLKQWVYNINLLQRALTGVDWRGGTCSQLEHCCATRPICLILPTNLCISSNDSRKLSSEVKGASLKWQLLARLDMKYLLFITTTSRLAYTALLFSPLQDLSDYYCPKSKISLGFWIPRCGDFKTLESGFHKQKFSGLWNHISPRSIY